MKYGLARADTLQNTFSKTENLENIFKPKEQM
jgi:hypothetical protein